MTFILGIGKCQKLIAKYRLEEESEFCPFPSGKTYYVGKVNLP